MEWGNLVRGVSGIFMAMGSASRQGSVPYAKWQWSEHGPSLLLYVLLVSRAPNSSNVIG